MDSGTGGVRLLKMRPLQVYISPAFTNCMVMTTQPNLPPQTVPANLFTSHSGPSNTLPVVAPSKVSAPPSRTFTAAELASRAFGNQQVPSVSSPLVTPTHSSVHHAAPANQIPVLLPVHVSYTLPNMTPMAHPTHLHAMSRVSVTLPLQ